MIDYNQVIALLLDVSSRFVEIILAPINNPDLLWILIPVYLVWFVTEYFQEKKETSFGNAATNGTITIWVSLDWMRNILNTAGITFETLPKIGISTFLILYGIFVVYESIKGKPVAKHIGRVKDISYFQVTLTPIMYGYIPTDIITILSVLMFYPIVRVFVTLIIDKLLPEPPYSKKEKQEDYDILFRDTLPTERFDYTSTQYSFDEDIKEFNNIFRNNK